MLMANSVSMLVTHHSGEDGDEDDDEDCSCHCVALCLVALYVPIILLLSAFVKAHLHIKWNFLKVFFSRSHAPFTPAVSLTKDTDIGWSYLNHGLLYCSTIISISMPMM